MQFETILKDLGLNDKEVAVYLALIEMGHSPVRVIAGKAKVNRGTTYDILKSLQDQGLVSFYDTKSHQYFVAEPPEKLMQLLEVKSKNIDELKIKVQQALPQIKAKFEKQGGKPTVKLYEGLNGIKHILEDVLVTMEASADKTYYIYSSSDVRKNVYLAMKDFSEKRIKKNIKVQSISLGEGGQLVGLDERKWMSPFGGSPEGGKQQNLKATYEIIYFGKVAHISLDNAENPVGVVIQNDEIYQTQKLIFENIWRKL